MKEYEYNYDYSDWFKIEMKIKKYDYGYKSYKSVQVYAIYAIIYNLRCLVYDNIYFFIRIWFNMFQTNRNKNIFDWKKGRQEYK